MTSGTKRSLTRQIFLGLGLGALTGLVLSFVGPSWWRDVLLIGLVLDVVGGLFINGIKMLVVPMVFVSLVCGVAAVGDVRKLGRLGGKAIAYYLATTGLAIALALGIGLLINPGADLDLASVSHTKTEIREAKPLPEVIKALIPENPLGALAEGSMLQIIFFALFFGAAASLVGPVARPILTAFLALNEIVMKMVSLIMRLAPIGVFALMAKTMATVGFKAVLPLAAYCCAVYLALILHVVLVYFGALHVIGRLSPRRFLQNFAPAMTVAFSTSSSNATLPVTLETVEKRCGVSNRVAAFALPLGATINMDGTAIMQGIAVVFIAQVYGIALPLQSLLMVILTATLASIGTAGVPGVGMVTLAMVLQSVGLPLEGIGLIMGIDRILDMGRTVVNVTGDAVCTILVAKSEGEFDEAVFSASDDDLVVP